MTCTRSGGQVGATLATAGRENRAAGTGAHTQPEAVGLRATTVVRLEGALAHSGAPEMIVCWRDIAWLSPCAHEKLASTLECTDFRTTDRDLCPSEAGGSSHRQLDLVTVRAATPSGQTGSAVALRRPYHDPRCTQPVDNNLNDAGRPDYRG